MTKIEGPSAIKPNRSIQRKKSNTISGSFGQFLSDEEEGLNPTAVTGGNQLSAINHGLLALQEVESMAISLNKEETFQLADDILQALEKIRIALLLGNLSKQKLEYIAQYVQKLRLHTIDPTLQTLMDDIELRAAVELAKWQL
jgi:hypothetical protein